MVRSDATAYLDNLGCAHVVYFHDGGDKSQVTEFDFIKKGVDKQQHCFYTTQNSEKILRQMKEFGVEVNSEYLHIVEIPEKFEDYSKMILYKVDGLPRDSEIRVLSTHHFDFDSEEKTDRMAEIEQCVDDDFHKIKGNFVCSFAVGRITTDIRSRFLNQLLESHRAIVFQTAKDGTEVFTLP